MGFDVRFVLCGGLDSWGGSARSALNTEDTRELEESLAVFLTGATTEVQHLKSMAVQTAATTKGIGESSLANAERMMPPYRHKGTIAADGACEGEGTVLQFQVNLVGTLNEVCDSSLH